MTHRNPPSVHAKRIGPTLVPDRSRVLMRPFRPTTEEISRRLLAQIMALSETEVACVPGRLMAEFRDRHHDVEKFFLNRFAKVHPLIADKGKPSAKRRALIGAYFTHEYSPESAALFNPSIVPHPDQSGVSRGALGFIPADRAARGILLLAESNYEVRFAEGHPVSQRVIFPFTPSQSNGIEDARFVRFVYDDGRRTYYATYTAYDGKIILPQLLETPDFVHFKFMTLNGSGVQNKVMALFPRKIDGRYAMISRQDDENILILFAWRCARDSVCHE